VSIHGAGREEQDPYPCQIYGSAEGGGHHERWHGLGTGYLGYLVVVRHVSCRCRVSLQRRIDVSRVGRSWRRGDDENGGVLMSGVMVAAHRCLVSGTKSAVQR